MSFLLGFYSPDYDYGADEPKQGYFQPYLEAPSRRKKKKTFKIVPIGRTVTSEEYVPSLLEFATEIEIKERKKKRIKKEDELIIKLISEGLI